jgi:hypothetical protein
MQMRFLKTLTAGFFLVALVTGFGAGTASATNLCSEAPNGANECPAGKAYAPPQNFESALEAKVKSQLIGTLTVECTTSSMKSELTELSFGLRAVGKIKTLTFTACESGGVPCTQEALPKGTEYKTHWERTTAGNGTQYLFAVELKVTCGAVSCTYKGEEMTMEVKGGMVAKVIAPGGTTKLKRTVGLEFQCGKEVEWKATYALTKPTALWLTN